MAVEREHVLVSALFKKLSLYGSEEEYDKALEVCDIILKKIPDDLDTKRTKITCLINLGKFRDALSLIETLTRSCGDKVQLELVLWKGYCLYRLGQYRECTQFLQQMEGARASIGINELLAQAYYRLEEYERSSLLYQSILKECNDDYVEERRANWLACNALQAQLTGKGDLPSSPSPETYEQCFNMSLVATSLGCLEESLEYLRQSEELCRQTMEEEGCEEEEIVEELNIVIIQRGFVYTMKKEHEKALEILQTSARGQHNDPTQVAIVSNNILVLNGGKDIFDSKKRAKLLSNEKNVQKLTRQQKQVILYNQCLFALFMGQTAVAKDMVAGLQKYEDTWGYTTMATVAMAIKQGQISKAVNLLCSYIKGFKQVPLLLHLTLAQLYQTHLKDPSQAVKTLCEISGLLEHLGLVAYTAALHMQEGHVQEACQLWKGAEVYWSGQKRSKQIIFLSSAATFLLHYGKPQESVQYLEQLCNLDPGNSSLLFRLVSAYSKFDPTKAEEVSLRLPQPAEVTTLDVKTLEQMPAHRRTTKSSATTVEKKKEVAQEKEREKKKKKHKKKPRLPKNCNPSISPDPERWLPLKERSYYKRGKRKTQSQMLRGTQGSSAGPGLGRLDATLPPVEEKAKEKGSTTTAPSKGKGQTKKKNRKKGKGW